MQRLTNMRMKINTYKLGTKKLKIAVWNIQSINIDYNTRRTKIMNIIKLVNDYMPDFFYIIDANRTLNIGGNYQKFFDGRNILWMRRDIKAVVDIFDGGYEIPELKLGFIYIIPNDFQKHVKKILEWNTKGFTYFGDFNIRTNRGLEKVINWTGGETTMQTGVGGKIEWLRILKAPSDHDMILVYVKRQVMASSILNLACVEDKSYRIVKDYLDGTINENNIARSEYKIKYDRLIEAEQEQTMLRILRGYSLGKSEYVYDRFGWLWRSRKKEPFMGSIIPEKVLDSFKKEIGHDENKRYHLVEVNRFPATFKKEIIDSWIRKDLYGNINKVKIEWKGLKPSYSNAITMENVALKKINEEVENHIRLLLLNKNTKQVRRLLLKLVMDHNYIIQHGNLYNMTFFLKKNQELNTYRDVRMITVAPTLIKIYEALIYDRALQQISKILKKKNYQYGALPGSSTYEAIFTLRSKVSKYKAVGIVSLDITKGYERIKFSNMRKALDRIEDEATRTVLLAWTDFVENCDYLINNCLVKATRGIPMGLSLSPLMFCLYLDEALVDCEKEYLVSFMDDMNILILEDEMSDVNIHNIINALEKFELQINDRKSLIFTDGEHFPDKRKEKFLISGKPMQVSSVATILGRELSWENNILTGEGYSYIEENKIPKVVPTWMAFCMRRLIYIGGLEAKQRYICYMWSYKKNNIRQKILTNVYSFFKVSFNKLSYVQLFTVIPNIFRQLVDYYTLKNLSVEIIATCEQYIDHYNQNIDIGQQTGNLSQEKQTEFREQIVKISKRVMEVFFMKKEEFDLPVNEEGIADVFCANTIQTLAKAKFFGWKDTKRVLDEIWSDFKLQHISLMQDRYDDEEREYYKISNIDWKYFPSSSKFGIISDMVFQRLEWNSITPYWNFIFNMIQKIRSELTEEEIFTVNMPKFVISSEKSVTERKEKVFDIVKWMYETEFFVFSQPMLRFRPYDELELESHELWKKRKSKIRKYRKFCFVLDCLYGDNKMKALEMDDLLNELRMKWWHVNSYYSYLEKVHIMQDWEDLEIDITKDDEEIASYGSGRDFDYLDEDDY